MSLFDKTISEKFEEKLDVQLDGRLFTLRLGRAARDHSVVVVAPFDVHLLLENFATDDERYLLMGVAYKSGIKTQFLLRGIKRVNEWAADNFLAVREDEKERFKGLTIGALVPVLCKYGVPTAIIDHRHDC